MPIRPPRLDDRSFDDLVQELVARIPAHTPEWTNPAVGDPGRTIIELFAWLADTILYRANLVPERQRLVFLKLLGITMRPAHSARGFVELQLDVRGSVEPVSFARGARLPGPPQFETLDEVTVFPFEGPVLTKRELDERETAEVSGIVRELESLYRIGNRARPYVTAAAFPDDAPRPEGFDIISGTVDRSLWIPLLASAPELAKKARDRINAGNDGRPFILNVTVVPSNAPVERFDEARVPHAIDHVWEASVGRDDRPTYRQLEVIHDGTKGLVQDGVVRLALAGGDLGAPSNDVRQQMASGVGDRPPRLDDAERADRLITWVRLRPTVRVERLAFTWVAINGVGIDQRITRENVYVAEGDGLADQVVQLPATSVEPESLRISVQNADGIMEPWARTEDLGGHRPTDRVYRLDAEAGTIHFGDGMRGLAPELARRIRIDRMRAGDGAIGNLPARKLDGIEGVDPKGVTVQAKVKVVQSLPTTQGRDAESLAEAERRIPAVLRHRNRAVTADDFRQVTLETPGADVGRVEVLPRFKPHQRRFDVPGVVSVMVLPRPSTEPMPPNPRADRPFLERVNAHLDARRTLGTELYVVGVEYVAIGVSVGVNIRDGFPRDQTLSDVRKALHAYLWPVAPYGPTGEGWPLGRTVGSREVEVAVARVRGISGVSDVRLFERDGDEWSEIKARDPKTPPALFLREWQLPELLSVVVVADQDAPTDLRGVPNPFDDPDRVAIPVVPEVC